MPGKRLSSQAQELILNVLEYFEKEKENGGPLKSANSVHEKAAAALKISERTIYTIRKRKSHNPVLSSPGKSRPRIKAKTGDMAEGTKMAVRDTLYNMYKERKHVTVKLLKDELANKEVVHMGTTSLGILLKELGFKFKKDDNRKALIERLHISSMRAFFLRKYEENRNSQFSRQVVFLDETWIYAKGSKRKSWQDDTVKSVRKPEGYDGKRYIIVHAGSCKGFVEGASLLFSSKSATGDYHGEMNHTIFMLWVKDKLIPNLQEPSVIVMDNAPYHSVLLEKMPCTSSKKSEIVEWLRNNYIHFDDNMTKLELLQIVKMHKKEKVYVIDELIRENGHEVLRLPPYHCDFNAIELIWAKCKNYYNTHIGRDGYGDDKVLSMWKEALENCGEDIWENCVRHTENIITQWYTREQDLANLEVEPLVINITDYDSSSTSELD